LEQRPLITIRVRKAEKVQDRLDRVSAGLDALKTGEYGQIVSDDEIMLRAAPKMISSLGKAKFIKTWKEDDRYHTLVEKI